MRGLRRGLEANTIRSDEGQGDSRSEFVDVVAGGPTAAFTVNPNPRLPGQYQFVSESTDPAGGALTESWVFGDGSSGTGRVITHTYAKPGSYPVTLTARNGQGKGASVTKTVVVKPPQLSVSIDVIGGPTSIKPDDTMKVDVTVSADSIGLGDLSGVSFDATTPKGLLAAPTDRMSLKAGGPSGLPSTLAPGGHATLHYVLVGGPKSGNVTLSSSVTARDVTGAPVHGAGTRNVNVSSGALVVTITPSKNDFTLKAGPDGKPTAETIQVTVKVVNTTVTPVDAVDVAPLDLAASDKKHPYEPFPAAVVGTNEDTRLGRIDPHSSKQFVRKLNVSGDGTIDLKELVTSSDGATSGLEQLRVGVTTLLEMAIDGDPVRQVHAGSTFRVYGHFTNVSADRTVALTNPIKVLHQGNVLGSGIIARADGQWLTSDYPPPLIQKLAPGKSVEFQIRLATAQPTPADYDEGTADAAQWTQGSIRFAFSPRAAVKEADGSWSALTAQPVQVNGKYPSSIYLKGVAAGGLDLQVDTSQPAGAATGWRRPASASLRARSRAHSIGLPTSSALPRCSPSIRTSATRASARRCRTRRCRTR